MMLHSCKLPLSFEPALLQTELERVEPGDWVPHFNKRYYEGAWSVAALRSVGGSSTQIYPDPTAQGNFADTPILSRCPYIRQVLAAFHCELQAVRFLKLSAGSRIREHKDYNLGFEDGEIRIHIPVRTNPQVEFYLGGERLMMHEGEAWYVNFNFPHRVANLGATDRVHLVIDCLLNDWLRAQFPTR